MFVILSAQSFYQLILNTNLMKTCKVTLNVFYLIDSFRFFYFKLLSDLITTLAWVLMDNLYPSFFSGYHKEASRCQGT
jgi:hypothetical protein